MGKYQLTGWNISMSIEFYDRFEQYRTNLNENKPADKKLNKADFGKFMFMTWEKNYLETIQSIEEKTRELKKEIEEKTKLLEELTPKKSRDSIVA